MTTPTLTRTSTGQQPRLAGTILAALGAAAMTFAGLMKIFNTDFRGDMADNYERTSYWRS